MQSTCPSCLPRAWPIKYVHANPRQPWTRYTAISFSVYMPSPAIHAKQNPLAVTGGACIRPRGRARDRRLSGRRRPVGTSVAAPEL